MKPHDLLERELSRVLSDVPEDDRSEFLLILPLVGVEDALRFLRTVPTGATAAEIQQLAATYRANHPPVGDEDATDFDRA